MYRQEKNRLEPIAGNWALYLRVLWLLYLAIGWLKMAKSGRERQLLLCASAACSCACLCFRAPFVVAVGTLHGSRKEKNAGNFCEAFSPRKSVEALCSCVDYFRSFFFFLVCLSLSIRSFVFSLCRSELRLSSFW